MTTIKVSGIETVEMVDTTGVTIPKPSLPLRSPNIAPGTAPPFDPNTLRDLRSIWEKGTRPARVVGPKWREPYAVLATGAGDSANGGSGTIWTDIVTKTGISSVSSALYQQQAENYKLGAEKWSKGMNFSNGPAGL